MRANELIEALRLDSDAFLHTPPLPWQMEGKHSDDHREFAFWGKIDRTPPVRLSIIAGEIVHHLRSALDHIVWEIACRKVGTPSPRLQFPIYSSAEAFEQALKRGEIKGVGKRALDEIENLQPFKQSVPQDTVLSVVQELNNVDKHRLLVVFAAVAELGQGIRIGDAPGTFPPRQTEPSIIGMSQPDLVTLTSTPAKVFSIQFGDPTPEMVAHADMLVRLVFERAGTTRAKFEVVAGLSMLHAGVSDTVTKLEHHL